MHTKPGNSVDAENAANDMAMRVGNGAEAVAAINRTHMRAVCRRRLLALPLGVSTTGAGPGGCHVFAAVSRSAAMELSSAAETSSGSGSLSLSYL